MDPTIRNLDIQDLMAEVGQSMKIHKVIGSQYHVMDMVLSETTFQKISISGNEQK